MSEAWIETYTGKQFDLLETTLDMIDIEDIAHSLAGYPRFTMHTKFPYPVGQHTRLGSYLVPKVHALRFLLHDASEAYLGDMSRPLKHFTPIGLAYQKVEKPLQRLIYKKFGIFGPDPDAIHDIDTQMLYAEKKALMHGAPWPHKWSRDEKAADVVIVETSFRQNKRLWLKRFHELYNK